MSAILRELACITSMVSTTLATTSAPRPATVKAETDSSLACLAAAAVCPTPSVSSSMEAAVRSRFDAGSSVRVLRLALAEAISIAPEVIACALARTCPTRFARARRMAPSEPITLPGGTPAALDPARLWTTRIG